MTARPTGERHIHGLATRAITSGSVKKRAMSGSFTWILNRMKIAMPGDRIHFMACPSSEFLPLLVAAAFRLEPQAACGPGRHDGRRRRGRGRGRWLVGHGARQGGLAVPAE